LVAGEARALLGGSLDASGNPLSAAPAPGGEVRLVRAHAPDAHPFFESTPVVDIEVWRPLQAKRVRYFYKPPPSPSASAAGSSQPPQTPSPTPPTAPAASAVRVQSPR
ncbi:MAG: hypothetical protein ACRELB_22540, partial [Polyangiaceae bacterium]